MSEQSTAIQGVPVSGRNWKDNRICVKASLRTQSKSVHDRFNDRKARDNAQKLIKLREAELKAETEQQKQRVKELRQERAERQKKNEKKAEQFQVITNVRKLKRLKKKQMRGIVKKNASDFLKPKVYGKLDD
ncbi:hypothetical protein MIR68_003680 [Amoeboaphelidium protococcarum]|nr:hypothetical protein MIR68_003680 [Amoeboaphelidium protococcarum]